MSDLELYEAAEKKKTVDDWLDEVNYHELNVGNYVPSQFALTYMNTIKMINGVQGESHNTPVVHLKMLDKMATKKQRVANLCARGMAKTTLFFEYLVPYLAIYNHIPNFGFVDSVIYVSDSMENGVKSARKNIEFRYNSSDFLQKMLPVAKFTDNYLYFENISGQQFGVKMFGAKTGLRGTKIFGKRPCLAVLDDLVSDDDAKSQVSMEAIKDTIYKGVDYALDPTRKKIIFNGTPFNKTDILYEAVESGAWDVNVWPICEKYPCSEEEFRSAWPDRFTYDYVKTQYDVSVLTGKLPAFNQELMLRITSEEERLIQDSELRWYDRPSLLANRHRFNFYITTDYATSDKQSADFSVISVWAYSSNGDWLWVDGVCRRQTMDQTMDQTFNFVSDYKPQGVGIEVTGQQGGFVTLFEREQLRRNIWFNMERVRPITNKLSRFNMVVPLFKAGKIWFPKQLQGSKIMGEFMSQIRLATHSGLKGKDDCLDTISMLGNMNPWKPSEETVSSPTSASDTWDMEEDTEPESALDSYMI